VLQRVEAECFEKSPGCHVLATVVRLDETKDVAVRCSVLQYAIVCCSVLQCVAACCSVLQLCCSGLQCFALCCSVVQVAVRMYGVAAIRRLVK